MGRKKGFVVSEDTKRKTSVSCKNVIVVHHINGNHFDDRPKNRMLLTPKEHAQIHLMQGDIYPYGATGNFTETHRKNLSLNSRWNKLKKHKKSIKSKKEVKNGKVK